MMETQGGTEAIELTARVVARQGRFVAAVHGLELEGSGSTPAAAEEALVQAMRNWLERQDTAGRLPSRWEWNTWTKRLKSSCNSLLTATRLTATGLTATGLAAN